MKSRLKNYFILFYFVEFYIYSLFNFWSNEYANIQLGFFWYVLNINYLFFFIVLIGVVVFMIKNKLLYIALKILIFNILMLLYFIYIEQLLIKLSMYSIGSYGGWIRNNIYEDIEYVFQWYEVLFWNFIFSLHYPLYIFIFFKPFVNHLDNSIRKIQEKRKYLN
ncbi:hypothetical protein N9818_01090 [Arcobacteraceae bacterium]|nr:hypothetical protein [Arcobacteraceae bacterium]